MIGDVSGMIVRGMGAGILKLTDSCGEMDVHQRTALK